MRKFKAFFEKNKSELIILLVAIIFSSWLMFSTFSYENGNIIIATKAWSDFASHIPLIRSFSFGDNFPPQYPLFSGPPIKYHFLFYAIVGMVEKLGIRIDFALNIPSIISFSFLILMIFKFSRLLFKKTSVSILSIIFFMFNGSLSFVKFINEHGLSKNILMDIITSNKFASFGPYDQSTISAFWNLNIYTNQRHLALSYALSLMILYILLKPFCENKKQDFKKNFLVGIILGLSFFLNLAVFLMTNILLIVLSILIRNYRKGIVITLAISSIIALPQYLFTSSGFSQISYYPGYLINGPINLTNFISYWFNNIGLYLILMPIAFFLTSKKLKIIFLSFFTLFIVGNLFKFSPEIAANHKFFNYFMIIGVMYTANLLVSIWNKSYAKPFVIIFIVFLTLSGIFDFFPILNDSKITLQDYPKNNDIKWVIKNTSANSVFLNTTYLYDTASLAGRKIFLGWPYFAWSQGYDTTTRDNLRRALLIETNKKVFCNLISNYRLDYVEINLNSQDTAVNKIFFDRNFPLVYKNIENSYYVYKIDSCHG